MTPQLMLMIGLATLAGLNAGCSSSAQPKAPAPVEVSVAEVVCKQISDSDEFTGRLEAVEVRPRVSGYLQSVHFKEGAIVRPGDLLFQIDPRPFQAEVDRLKGDLAQARAQLSRAESHFQRAERLHNNDGMSAEEYDRRAAVRTEDGLHEGDVIIVSGLQRVRPGVIVAPKKVSVPAQPGSLSSASTQSVLTSMRLTPSPAEPMLYFQDVALERTRVASGEYRIVEQNEEGGIGLFAPGVYNFRESWTIWRLKDGSFEVEGERSYESPKGELQNNGFHVRLSSAFRVLGVKESRKLRWRHDSGPLACDFLSDEIFCSSASTVPDQSVRWNMPAKEPYGFFWPLSAFPLASIARSADRDPTRESQVQLLTLHEPNATFPIFGTVTDAQLRYSGQEQITAADRQWNAEKFELTVFLYSKFVIWVSPEGLFFSPLEGEPVVSLDLRER